MVIMAAKWAMQRPWNSTGTWFEHYNTANIVTYGKNNLSFFSPNHWRAILRSWLDFRWRVEGKKVYTSLVSWCPSIQGGDVWGALYRGLAVLIFFIIATSLSTIALMSWKIWIFKALPDKGFQQKMHLSSTIVISVTSIKKGYWPNTLIAEGQIWQQPPIILAPSDIHLGMSSRIKVSCCKRKK